MNPGQLRAHRMGTEPIPKLLLEFSIPVMTGMIVQAVYSVINRAFIGNAPEAATLGMAAITVGMPLIFVMMAFGMLIGFGGSAALSLYLGQKDQDRAEQVLGNSFTLSVLASALLTAVGIIFLDPLLIFLGATPDVLPAARSYNLLILIGTLPMTIGFGMNNFIRAEGNPKTSMINMVVSALLNVVFDFVFIMILHWGVAGAALGTVVAQTITSILVIQYFYSKKSHVHFHWKNLRLKKEIVLKAALIGSSPFFMQIGASLVQLVLNNQLKFFGGKSALAAWGIIQTVGMFFLFPIFGINGGAQPLVGYNYGAKNFLRVRTTAKWAILAATFVTLAAFAVLQIFPNFVVGIFSGGDSTVLNLGVFGLKVVFLLLPILGFQIIAAGYFTSVGKPTSSMLLTLSRQVIFLLPLAWIFPLFWGLDGIFWAAPAADSLAAVLTLIFFAREFHLLGAKQKSHDATSAQVAPEASTTQPISH